MSRKDLTLHERIRNADASQQVENIKAEHAYLHARADTVGEFGRIWCLDDNSSWAHLFGRMRGKDQIWWGGVTHYDMLAMKHWLSIMEKYPEIGGKDPRQMMEASVHTLSTDVIEVAADGLSARGEFFTPGLIQSKLMPTKPYCMIAWERYGSDFVCIDGEWKYLHEQCCPDLAGELDRTNWAHDDYMLKCRFEGDMFFDPDEEEHGTGTDAPIVTDPGPLHMPYSCIRPPLDSVPWPVPYDTLSDENSYTPLVDHDAPYITKADAGLPPRES